MSCVTCGQPTQRRQCRDCELAERYESDDWPPEDEEEDDLRADGGEIECCPECKYYEINRRINVADEDERYRCYGCGATFAHPETRRNYGGHAPPHGPARKLLEMDPDDVPGPDVRADGGCYVWAGPGDTGTPPDVRAFREDDDA